MAQQPKETAACEGAEHVNDGHQNRERRAQAKAEKRHGDDAEILEREDEDRGDEHNDNCKIEPAHGRLIRVDRDYTVSECIYIRDGFRR